MNNTTEFHPEGLEPEVNLCAFPLRRWLAILAPFSVCDVKGVSGITLADANSLFIEFTAPLCGMAVQNKIQTIFTASISRKINGKLCKKIKESRYTLF